MEKKYTERDMLMDIINGTVSAETVAKAEERVIALDKRNEKRKSKPSKATLENVGVKNSIVEFLNGKDFTLGTDIAKALELSINKVSSLCVRMVGEGTLVGTEISVAKVGKRKAYKLA